MAHLLYKWLAGTYVHTTTTESCKMAPILDNLCIAYIFAILYQRSMTILPVQVETHRGQVFFDVDG